MREYPTTTDGHASYASRVAALHLDAWTGEHAPLTGAPPPDRAAEPESMVVPVGTGVRIHYLDWGAPLGGDPATTAGRGATPPTPATPTALLLIPGISQTAWSWAPVARRLSHSTRVLAIDLRGHGLSEVPRNGYELESLAWDGLTVLAANGFGVEVGGPPAVVAGHGFGAQVAATMGALQPASVAGVALVDGGWEDVGEATRLSSAEFLAGLAEPPEVLRTMDAFLADRRGFDPASWDADQERAARAQVDQKVAGHVVMVSRPVAVRGLVDAMYSYRPETALAAIPSPLLVCVAESGAADDDAAHERALALGDVLRARHTEAQTADRVVRFPGSGHNLMRYRPDELAAELLALVRLGPCSRPRCRPAPRDSTPPRGRMRAWTS